MRHSFCCDPSEHRFIYGGALLRDCKHVKRQPGAAWSNKKPPPDRRRFFLLSLDRKPGACRETTDQRHDKVCQFGVVILLADGGHGRHGDRDSAKAESGVADAAGDDEEEPCLLALRGKSLPVQV